MSARWVMAALALSVACTNDTTPRPSLIEVRTSPYGEYIADDAGRALYSFSADAPGQPSCLTHCATVWLPVSVDRLPSANRTTLDASKFAIVTRADGIRQLTFAGHPLYYSATGLESGNIWGHYAMSFGGHFALVAPSGKPLPPPK